MTDANQVRINELARELEVKAKAIIDLLPGFGVAEKKTHSSSIPVDVAEKVRRTIQGQAEQDAAAESAVGGHDVIHRNDAEHSAHVVPADHGEFGQSGFGEPAQCDIDRVVRVDVRKGRL